MDAGIGSIFYFRAKPSRLRNHYIKKFGAVPLGQYDPFRWILWEDAAEKIISEYEKAVN